MFIGKCSYLSGILIVKPGNMIERKPKPTAKKRSTYQVGASLRKNTQRCLQTSLFCLDLFLYAEYPVRNPRSAALRLCEQKGTIYRPRQERPKIRLQRVFETAGYPVASEQLATKTL
jgi:hypothetical protein